MLPLLIEKTNKILVLSGILTEQQKQLETELKKLGIENTEIQTLGEWISVKCNF